MDDSVSAFIVGTCRTLPKSNTNVYKKVHMRDPRKPGWDEHYVVCGSCVEFFIQPLQPCMGDVDYLMVSSDCLVFTEEQRVLPYEFRHITHPIDCLLMEPYHDYPAFVRFRIFGEMSYDWERKTLKFVNANTRKFVDMGDLDENGSAYSEDLVNVGPALRGRMFETDSESFDVVASMWCPQWPNVAKEWPNRRRNYGWPTTAIMHEVVQNGCHVVRARHPSCRNDRRQCRLSFSVAEVILLQSWTNVQQIVYHMLKFFAKRELIVKDCLKKDDEVLCTYHIKTLMLWLCEKKSTEWWNSLSVIKTCCKLLKKLEHCLKVTRCRNYFIPQANLFHGHFIQKNVEETNKKIIFYSDSENLSLWFVENYMQPSFLDLLDEKCTHDILSLDYMSKILEAKNASYPKSMDLYFSIRFTFVASLTDGSKQDKVHDGSLDFFKYSFRLLSRWRNDTLILHAAEFESCYGFYESMLFILHAAYLLGCTKDDLCYELYLEIITGVLIKPIPFRSKHHIVPRPLNAVVNEGLLCLIEAQILMENLTGSSGYLGFQVASEISKGLLIKALAYEDNTRKSIARVILAYLAALHFAKSDYHIAIDLSSRVVINKYCEKEETETLNSSCLLYIEDISIIIGFYLIFLMIKDASLHYTKRPFFVDLRLTPEVFAHYLTISSIEKIDRPTTFGYNNIDQTAASPLDAILIAITNRKPIRNSKNRKNVMCVYQRTNPIHNLETTSERWLPNEDDIIQLLMELSLDNMTLFYNGLSNDFDIDCSTVDCYRAAFLYQGHKYSEVYHLCERILNERDLKSDLKELAFANVMILPPLDCYFDEDIQCLLGLHTLVSKLLASNAGVWKIEDSETLISENVFSGSLSKVLARPYHRKCFYFLGRHFLARYLRVRCLIDCNHSLSEVESEFTMLKACLPFEQIIRCFLESKLRQFHYFLHVRPKV